MVKKSCPACNSKKFNQVSRGRYACARCGYTYKDKDLWNDEFNKKIKYKQLSWLIIIESFIKGLLLIYLTNKENKKP